MQYRSFFRIHSLIIVISFILAFAVSSVFYFRLDVSRDRAFSISEYSRELAQGLENPVSVTYFLSQTLENRVPAIAEVRDILQEYARLGRGMITVEVLDPDEGDQIRPEDLGIAPRELQVVENNEQTIARVYSGIAISYLDSLEIIPLVTNSAALEYELSSRILNLSRQTKPLIDFLIATSAADPAAYETLTGYLNQFYRIRTVFPGDILSPQSDAIFVLGAAGILDSDLFQIEQRMMAGTGVFFAVESAEVDIQQNLNPVPVTSTVMFDFLEHHGIRVRNSWVLDEISRDIPIQEQQGRVLVNTLEPYPLWPAVQASNTDETHPLTSRFTALDLYWASSLDVSEELRGESLSILMTSSQISTQMTELATDPGSAVSALISTSLASSGNLVLGLAYEGPITSYFDQVPLTLSSLVLEDQLRETDTGRMVVIGDSDFPGELFQVTNADYNVLFMQSLAEFLTGNERLLELRTRGQRNTRLDSVPDQQSRNRILFFAEVVQLVIIPLLLIAFSLRHFYLRRRSSAPRLSTIPSGSRKDEPENE